METVKEWPGGQGVTEKRAEMGSLHGTGELGYPIFPGRFWEQSTMRSSILLLLCVVGEFSELGWDVKCGGGVAAALGLGPSLPCL